MDPVEYVFRIDAFTPATIPMQRLGEYLTELGKMFGHAERTHFLGLTEGSAQVHAGVDYVDAPKVAQRLAQVSADDAPKEAMSAKRNINEMLAEDNAVATLYSADGNVLVVDFIGRNRVKPLLFPAFKEETSIEGQLVAVGGRDKTAHATLQDGDRVHSGIWMSREIARDLAPLLYGPTLRLFGVGKFERQADGVWKMLDFRTDHYEELLDEPATATLRKIGEIPTNGLMNPLAHLFVTQERDDGGDDT